MATGGKWFFHLTANSPSSREARDRAQGWILDTGTETQATEECCLLASFPFLLSAFLTQPRSICLGMLLPTLGLTILHQLAIKKMSQRYVPNPIWYRGSFSIEAFFSQMSLVVSKVYKNQPGTLRRIHHFFTLLELPMLRLWKEHQLLPQMVLLYQAGLSLLW